MGKVLEVLGRLIFVAGCAIGLGVLGWQVFVWLQAAKWTPISMVTGLRWLEFSWAVKPTGWRDVHKLLDDFPLAIGLPLLAWAVGWVVIYVAKDMGKPSNGQPTKKNEGA